MPNNHRQKVYDNGTLGIHQVESGIDEDLYACIARNKEGKSSRSSLYIAVKSKFCKERRKNIHNAYTFGEHLDIWPK